MARRLLRRTVMTPTRHSIAAFFAVCLAAGSALATSYADTHPVVLTWRNEGVAHEIEKGDGVRPPVLHLAPGFATLSDADQALVVDELAAVVEPKPRVMVVRGFDGALIGRWTPEQGFERLD